VVAHSKISAAGQHPPLDARRRDDQPATEIRPAKDDQHTRTQREQNEHVHACAIDTLLRQPPVIVLVGGVCVNAVEIAAYLRTRDAVFLTSTLAVAVIVIWRAIVGFAYHRFTADGAPPNVRRWEQHYVIPAVLQSSVIGLSCLWAFLFADAGTAFLLTAVVIGGGAGALRGFVLPYLVRVQNGSLIMPTVIGCAFSSHPNSWVVIVSVCGFLLVADGIVRTMHGVMVSSLRQSEELGRLCAELKGANDRIHKLAHEDALTGLPNRRAFVQLLDGKLINPGSDEQLAILTVDLDGFKMVNDTFGHGAGDELLRQVAKRLRLTLRTDDFCARIGGDEFVVVSSGEHITSNATALAERLCRVIEHDYLLPEGLVRVGASIGIAVAPKDGRTAEELMRKSDAALYIVKGAGKGAYAVFEPRLRAPVQRML
jgi:diguanylate cyclase (GGDEF)-like protein